MESKETAKVTASSFLSLPPELRLQIYRCLLCHSSWIQSLRLGNPWYMSEEGYSPESAILRTCRTIYSEALPILYGENTFLYQCWTTSLSDDVLIGSADIQLKRMRHLILQIGADFCVEKMAAATVAAAIQYFVKRDCDLHTFKLKLERVVAENHDEIRHHLLGKTTASQEVMAALAELKVSKALTISYSYGEYGETSDHPPPKSLSNDLSNNFQDFVNRLAARKEMTATKQVESMTLCEGPARDRIENRYSFMYKLPARDRIEDRYSFLYKLSWCLRPRRSEQQRSKIANASD